MTREESKIRNQKIIQDYQSGMRLCKLAEKYIMDASNVYYLLAKAKLIVKGRDKHNKRTKNHNPSNPENIQEEIIDPIILKLREKYRNLKVDKSERFITSHIGVFNVEYTACPKRSRV